MNGLLMRCFHALRGSPIRSSSSRSGVVTPSAPERSFSTTPLQLLTGSWHCELYTHLFHARGLRAPLHFPPVGHPEPLPSTLTTIWYLRLSRPLPFVVFSNACYLAVCFIDFFYIIGYNYVFFPLG